MNCLYSALTGAALAMLAFGAEAQTRWVMATPNAGQTLQLERQG